MSEKNLKSRLVSECATVAVWETPMPVHAISPFFFLSVKDYEQYRTDVMGKDTVFVYSSVASIDNHARVIGYSAQPAGPEQKLDDQYRLVRSGAGYGTIPFLENQFSVGGIRKHSMGDGKDVSCRAFDEQGRRLPTRNEL